MDPENNNSINKNQANKIPDSNLSSESSTISDYEMASVAPKGTVIVKKILKVLSYILIISLLILAGVGIYFLTL